jgi:hypothetical protein
MIRSVEKLKAKQSLEGIETLDILEGSNLNFSKIKMYP